MRGLGPALRTHKLTFDAARVYHKMSDCPPWILDKLGVEQGAWDSALDKLSAANPESEEAGGYPDLSMCACETYKLLQITHQCLAGVAMRTSS